MLKFVAWDDNGIARDGRDAVDLFTLLGDHHEILGLDALYDDHAAVMESYSFDDQLAGAHVLGQRVSRQLNQRLRGLIESHLAPRARETPVVTMIRGRTPNDIDQAEALLAAFEAGLGS